MTTPTIYSTVRDALDARGFHYQLDRSGDNSILATCSASNGNFRALFQCKESMEVFIVYMNLGAKARTEQDRLRAAEFMARANFGMNVGNFELDMRDGEMRFKTSVCVQGGALTPTMINVLLGVSIRTTNQYFPGFMKVLYGGVSPAEAVRMVETGVFESNESSSGQEPAETSSQDERPEETATEPAESPAENSPPEDPADPSEQVQ